MLNDFNCSCPVYIACGYTDLRRGIDGLATVVKSQFQMDPFQRALFDGGAEDRAAEGKQSSERSECNIIRESIENTGFLSHFVVSFSYGK